MDRPLSEDFPVVFACGARWTSFRGSCGACGADVPDRRLTGRVTRPLGGGGVALVEAVGRCACGGVTRFSYRLMPDMTLVGRSPRTGEWSAWAPRRSWWRRLLRALGL